MFPGRGLLWFDKRESSWTSTPSLQLKKDDNDHGESDNDSSTAR